MNAKRCFFSAAVFTLLLITSNVFGYAADNNELQLKLHADIRQGQEAYFAQKYTEVERIFRGAAEQAKALGQKGLYAYSCAFVGYALVYQDRGDEAEAILKQAEKDSIESNTPLARTLTNLALLNHYGKRGDIATQQKYIKALLTEKRSNLQAMSINWGSLYENHIQAKELRKLVANASVPIDAEDYFEDTLVKEKILHWSGTNRIIKIYTPPASSFEGWKPAYAESLERAFRTWQEILENQVQFEFVKKEIDADVIINWHVNNRQQIGDTFFSRYGNTLTNADINFHLKDENNNFLTPETFYRISLHEVGHLLGIVGHSQNPIDIMFPTLTYTAKPSARDIATIRKIYAQTPDITNPAGKTLSEYRQELLSQKKYPVPVVGHFYH